MRLCDVAISEDLHRLGYDDECYRWYSKLGTLKIVKTNKSYTPAPRLDDVAYWIRDRYKLYISIYHSNDKEFPSWHFEILNLQTLQRYEENEWHYFDYDDALEYAIKKTIQIIKRQNNETPSN